MCQRRERIATLTRDEGVVRGGVGVGPVGRLCGEGERAPDPVREAGLGVDGEGRFPERRPGVQHGHDEARANHDGDRGEEGRQRLDRDDPGDGKQRRPRNGGDRERPPAPPCGPSQPESRALPLEPGPQGLQLPVGGDGIGGRRGAAGPRSGAAGERDAHGRDSLRDQRRKIRQRRVGPTNWTEARTRTRDVTSQAAADRGQ